MLGLTGGNVLFPSYCIGCRLSVFGSLATTPQRWAVSMMLLVFYLRWRNKAFLDVHLKLKSDLHVKGPCQLIALCHPQKKWINKVNNKRLDKKSCSGEIIRKFYLWQTRLKAADCARVSQGTENLIQCCMLYVLQYP